MASQITDHTDQALERLVEQFKEKANIVKLLTALTGTVQDAEDALWALFVERTVDTAIGVHLDAIGKKVGQVRGGMIDETYRRFIRARIATNRSRGTIGDVLRIARLVLNDADAYLRLRNHGAASYDLVIRDVVVTDELAEVLLDFLRAATGATAAGVRVSLETQSEDADRSFRWNTAGRGWSSVSDPSSGGLLNSAREG